MDLTGKRVQRYEVERIIQTFVFENIYLGRDPILGRHVLLKVQNEIDGVPIGGQLLENEASTLAQLSHPGIQRVHDVGLLENGCFYLVAEYLDGGSLEAALQARSLQSAAVVGSVREAADAVGFVHRRGYVHRNLNPRTIYFDGEGRARVVGFSLSSRVSDLEVTQALTLVGGAEYAAPEQLLGDTRSIGPASDVWSLGATLYEALTGRLPFGQRHQDAWIKGEPRLLTPLPFEASEATPELERICFRCLAMDPTERFPDAFELARALGDAEASTRPALDTPRVFVSHSSKDREFVEREIIGFLERNGVPTWYAKAEIDSAEQWERTIVRGLESCEWFLLVMSPRSAESEWVRDEVYWAIVKRPNRILPLLLEPCDPWKFNIRIARLQHIDWMVDPDEGRRVLLRSLLPT